MTCQFCRASCRVEDPRSTGRTLATCLPGRTDDIRKVGYDITRARQGASRILLVAPNA